MTRAFNIVETVKKELKKSGVTYRALAQRLQISESAVKQMFASGNFSLRRLDEICEVLGLDLAELMDLVTSSEAKMELLDIDQERELVGDIKLLLVAYCLVNYWKVEDITQRYALEQKELIRILAKLDRMKLIELLPENRVRLLISNNFKWHANGPIERYFQSQVQEKFFKGSFNLDGALRLIKNGDITSQGQKQLMERMEAIGNLFDDISKEERKEPVTKRKGTTMILAIRNWRFDAFHAFERV
ncbi:MAG: helix-turn-helix transcriptional regulator [Acidiferrobacterales bacterium]|nr:helix-turn-helix transcriptional regulator [Acidiferrobacterales bacterium]